MKSILCIVWMVCMLASSAFTQCSKDTECKGNRVCVNGQCVEPEANASLPSGGSAAAAVSVPLGGVTLYTHPLGFLQFGPIVGLEFGANDGLTIDAHWRYSKLGFAYNAVIQAFNPDDDMDVGFGSMGFGSQVRYYFPMARTAGRPYVGGMFEYNIDKSTKEKGERWETTHDNRQIAFCATGGYRFRIGQGFNLTLGIIGGCAFSTISEWSYVNQSYAIAENEPGTREGDPVTVPFGMLELGMGWEFGRGR